MDHEKPIICFSSTRRLSSSPSMKKHHSKSILSPNRSIDNNSKSNKQISLSASLSRRLRTNTSMKGGQSPMFPTGSKKRGSGFENTEPTSPKVTCIGQVRVKTKKKQLNQMRSLSNRRSSEASFRKIEPKSENQNHQNLQFPGYLNTQEGLQQRNQKWVHIPLTICEALRGFGSEINCFLPCKSSCFSRAKEKDGGAAVFQQSSCFYGEIEIVVGGEEDQVTERSYHRRHVMEDIDISELEKCNVVVEQQEGGRVSICVPPKNALLLMRCRSDPLKMASLANKFWESNVEDDSENEEIEYQSVVDILEVDKEIVEKLEPFEVVQETEHVEDEEIVEKLDALEVVLKADDEKGESFEDLVVHEACLEEDGVPEETSILVMEMNGDDLEDTQECFDEFEHVHEDIIEIHQELILISSPSQEILEIHENQSETTSLQQNNDVECEANEVPRTSIQLYSVSHWFLESEEEEIHEMESEIAERDESFSEEKSTSTHEKPEPETHEITPPVVEEEERLEKRESDHENRVIPESKNRALPDCLLMMMCEPKLSMEVSKETWVCTTDFIRCVPSSNKKKVNKTNGRDEIKKRVSIDCKPRPPIRDSLLQPPRSSVSFPISSAKPFSMAAMIEQKLGNSAAGYEPFGLTRCKSAPIRSAAPAKFAKPEACYWRNRKMEPHRAAVGVGAAGF